MVSWRCTVLQAGDTLNAFRHWSALLFLLFCSTCALPKVMLCGAEVSALDVNGCSPIFYSVALGYVDATRFSQSIFSRLSIKSSELNIQDVDIAWRIYKYQRQKRKNCRYKMSVLRKLQKQQITLFSSLRAFGFIFPCYLPV